MMTLHDRSFDLSSHRFIGASGSSSLLSFRLSWVAGRQIPFCLFLFLLYSDVIIPPSLLLFWPLAHLFPCVCVFACTSLYCCQTASFVNFSPCSEWTSDHLHCALDRVHDNRLFFSLQDDTEKRKKKKNTANWDAILYSMPSGQNHGRT